VGWGAAVDVGDGAGPVGDGDGAGLVGGGVGHGGCVGSAARAGPVGGGVGPVDVGDGAGPVGEGVAVGQVGKGTGVPVGSGVGQRAVVTGPVGGGVVPVGVGDGAGPVGEGVAVGQVGRGTGVPVGSGVTTAARADDPLVAVSTPAAAPMTRAVIRKAIPSGVLSHASPRLKPLAQASSTSSSVMLSSSVAQCRLGQRLTNEAGETASAGGGGASAADADGVSARAVSAPAGIATTLRLVPVSRVITAMAAATRDSRGPRRSSHWTRLMNRPITARPLRVPARQQSLGVHEHTLDA
jgi:hypothetical protein